MARPDNLWRCGPPKPLSDRQARTIGAAARELNDLRRKLTDDQVRAIRRRYTEGQQPGAPRVTMRALAREYGVSTVAVHFIVRRRIHRGIAA
jgi:predicted DNA binding protein